MNGSDLIALASHLIVNTALGNAEARYRSAISRAYYGAFHLAVSFLEDVAQVRILQNHTGHNQVFLILSATGIPAAVKAADSLNEMRSARNQADYKLRARGFASRERAQKWVEEAMDIASCLEGCQHEPNRSQVAIAIKSGTIAPNDE